VSKGADHVTRQFQRVHGPDGPTPDAEGKRRGTLEVPRLRRRPGDERLKQPVGRDAPNRPDDVARLQRALSETGDYTFTAPRERSGVMSANLETALTRYQRRTGLKPDGVVAPDGPTIQRVNAETEAVNGEEKPRLQLIPRRQRLISNISPDQKFNLKPENTSTPEITEDKRFSEGQWKLIQSLHNSRRNIEDQQVILKKDIERKEKLEERLEDLENLSDPRLPDPHKSHPAQQKQDPRYHETKNSNIPKTRIPYISKIRRYGELAQEAAARAAEEANDAIFMSPKIEEIRRRIQDMEREIQRRRDIIEKEERAYPTSLEHYRNKWGDEEPWQPEYFGK
jgi:hypothetical protein